MGYAGLYLLRPQALVELISPTGLAIAAVAFAAAAYSITSTAAHVEEARRLRVPSSRRAQRAASAHYACGCLLLALVVGTGSSA
jgi:hypothetical protein